MLSSADGIWVVVIGEDDDAGGTMVTAETLIDGNWQRLSLMF